MATSSYRGDLNQSTVKYVKKKGIYELFEAMMTALMIHKPNDHITFIRECLDKAQSNPNHIHWDFFVTQTNKSQSASSFKSSRIQNRYKPLPLVKSSDHQTSILPPIHNHKTNSPHLPIIFILSSTGSTKLCSRLLERYNQLSYFLINNFDEDEQIVLQQHEHRYDYIKSEIDQHRSRANGFLIAGELDEENFLTQWQDKLDRIDLIFIISSNTHQSKPHENFHIIQIDSDNDFDDILTNSINALDKLFPQDAFLSQRSHPIVTKTTLPIIFCIDNHRISIKGNVLLDEEFEMSEEEEEEEENNSFFNTLCQRLAEQFSFKHIHYGDFNKTLWNFHQLKMTILPSIGIASGYIIDHFPTSFDDLQRFQSEIGPCSVLIYIGEHRTVTKDDDLNAMIEKFKEDGKAIYVDCRMEVDEIYEDLKNDILKYI